MSTFEHVELKLHIEINVLPYSILQLRDSNKENVCTTCFYGNWKYKNLTKKTITEHLGFFYRKYKLTSDHIQSLYMSI